MSLNINYLVVFLVLYIIIIIFLGCLIARTLHRHHKDLDAIQKNYHSIVEDLTAIAEHLEKTNKKLIDMENKIKNEEKNE